MNRIALWLVSPVYAPSADTPRSPAMTAGSPHVGQTHDVLAYCLRREHLRRTTRIALVVGLVLTAINQGAAILGGDASTLTWARIAVNFLIPFVVSNLGLLSGRGGRSAPAATVGPVDDEP